MGWVVNSTPRLLYPRGKTRFPLYRRLGGHQGPSGRVRKTSPPPGFDTRTVQPVASRYTDWAIAALDNACVSVASQGISCVLRSGFKYVRGYWGETERPWCRIGFNGTLFRCPPAALLSRLSLPLWVWVISLPLLRGHFHYRREGSKFRLQVMSLHLICVWSLRASLLSASHERF